MLIEKLEDLNAWQEARILAKMVYNILEKLPRSEEYNIHKHLRECARSVPGNIAEGFGRYHCKDSMQFYRIARGSLNEMKSDLYLSLNNYMCAETHNKIIKQSDKVGGYINGLIKATLKRSNCNKK
jgi:four helix bundle protein